MYVKIFKNKFKMPINTQCSKSGILKITKNTIVSGHINIDHILDSSFQDLLGNSESFSSLIDIIKAMHNPPRMQYNAV